MRTMDEIEGVHRRIRADLLALGRVVVACSGGVDSTLLAVLAHDVLDHGALAVTAISPSLPAGEVDELRALAATMGLRWQSVVTDELARPGYVENAGDRCFHCKSELFDALAPIAAREQAVIAVGTIADDLGDHRPGLRAAAERGVRTPLADAGCTKEIVRELARRRGLDVWDKPAAACLASRVPYGTPVTLGVLDRVGRAEDALHALGFRHLRVRHYGDAARIEVPLDDLRRVVDDRVAVITAVRDAGYAYVTLDLEGLRSGNLNAALHGDGRP